MRKLPALETRTAPGAPGSIDTEIVLIFQDSDKKPAIPSGAYRQMVERFRKNKALDGGAKSMQFVRFGGQDVAESVLFVGAGTPSNLTEEKLRMAGGSAWSKLNAEKATSTTIRVAGLSETRGLPDGLNVTRVIGAFAEGFTLASYDWDKYKTKSGKAAEGDEGSPKGKDDYEGPEKLTVVVEDKSLKRELDETLGRIADIGECVRITRDWSNEPSNHGTPEYFAEEAQKLARQFGIKCTVLTEKDAEREKMGLFLGVGRGSEREGRVVVLDYSPKGAQKASKGPKTIALVGKGITFDSGGISIKPSMKMEEMKHDMTGAATVLGAILLASKWKVNNRVVAVLGFTENMPDGSAIQPGNVITSRSGKTVEVINTDAEGRLILADLLDYAHTFKPDAIINAATLTGAVAVALGKHACGILGNHDELIQAVRKAGEGCGERIWQLPLFDEYFEDMKSDTADMKNSANNSYGGTIRGAIFLKQFIKKGMKWAHLDIAATAWDMGQVPYYPKKGASGAYVRTLAHFVDQYR